MSRYQQEVYDCEQQRRREALSLNFGKVASMLAQQQEESEQQAHEATDMGAPSDSAKLLSRWFQERRDVLLQHTLQSYGAVSADRRERDAIHAELARVMWQGPPPPRPPFPPPPPPAPRRARPPKAEDPLRQEVQALLREQQYLLEGKEHYRELHRLEQWHEVYQQHRRAHPNRPPAPPAPPRPPPEKIFVQPPTGLAGLKARLLGLKATASRLKSSVDKEALKAVLKERAAAAKARARAKVTGLKGRARDLRAHAMVRAKSLKGALSLRSLKAGGTRLAGRVSLPRLKAAVRRPAPPGEWQRLRPPSLSPPARVRPAAPSRKPAAASALGAPDGPLPMLPSRPNTSERRAAPDAAPLPAATAATPEVQPDPTAAEPSAAMLARARGEIVVEWQRWCLAQDATTHDATLEVDEQVRVHRLDKCPVSDFGLLRKQL